MEGINFLSAGTFVILPTKSNPKVFLSIDNRKQAALAFNLYNPFSKKAKILKACASFLCLYASPLKTLFLPTLSTNKSDFIRFLEDRLKITSLTSSVYIGTIKDKVVLQLQADNKVIGYLKYPLNTIGLKHVLNEKSAITILSANKLIDPYLLSATYKETPFLLLKELEGNIKQSKAHNIDLVLETYKKQQTYLLKEHPRILQLQHALKTNGFKDLLVILEHIGERSVALYHEVFEHGDFSPWNLIQTEKGCIPFDFEYFEEHGLQYLDKIKYHYQISYLLDGKVGSDLVEAVALKVNINEFLIVFKVFLIKEIINKYNTLESYDFENSLLKLLTDAKA